MLITELLNAKENRSDTAGETEVHTLHVSEGFLGYWKYLEFSCNLKL